jgi:type IV secretory pathway VirB4 component
VSTASRTHRLPDYLPWACLVAPGMVLQKDAILQKTIAFRGPDLASSSPSELLSAVARLNNALKRLGSGWAFFIEAQRFEATRYPAATWRQPAAWIVDLERRKTFESSGAHFESAYFLTIAWVLSLSLNCASLVRRSSSRSLRRVSSSLTSVEMKSIGVTRSDCASSSLGSRTAAMPPRRSCRSARCSSTRFIRSPWSCG